MMMFRLAKGLFPFFLYLALQILAYKYYFPKRRLTAVSVCAALSTLKCFCTVTQKF